MMARRRVRMYVASSPLRLKMSTSSRGGPTCSLATAALPLAALLAPGATTVSLAAPLSSDGTSAARDDAELAEAGTELRIEFVVSAGLYLEAPPTDVGHGLGIVDVVPPRRVGRKKPPRDFTQELSDELEAIVADVAKAHDTVDEMAHLRPTDDAHVPPYEAAKVGIDRVMAWRVRIGRLDNDEQLSYGSSPRRSARRSRSRRRRTSSARRCGRASSG